MIGNVGHNISGEQLRTFKTLVATATLAGCVVVLSAGIASAWATKSGDKALTGAELGKLIVGKHLHYVFSKQPKMTGVVGYKSNGHYTVDIDSAGKATSWAGPYHITPDGQVCSTRDGVNSGESCELFVLAGGKKLTKINGMDERYTPTIK
ncbi:MAG: hypothetical protein ABIQ30_09590 [Devosia sp.]